MIGWLKDFILTGRWIKPWAWGQGYKSAVPEGADGGLDYESWKPRAWPPDSIEIADAVMDHVFSAKTAYWVHSERAHYYDGHPGGEGNPDKFVIVRSQRKLPAQFDENGLPCRQIDLELLVNLGMKCLDLEGRLVNLFDLDAISKEDFEALWLEGSEGDKSYWSGRAG